MASKMCASTIPATFVVIAFVLIAAVTPQAQALIAANFSCALDTPEFHLDIDKKAGVWYEVLRVPDAAVPACVKVTAPKTVVDGWYNVDVEYVNNVGSLWQQTNETIPFPWAKAEKGLFELFYEVDGTSIEVDFKIVVADDSLAVICGYSGVSASTALLKVMSRDRILNATMEDKVNSLISVFGGGVDARWVEQSSKCNGAGPLMPAMMLMILTGLGFLAKY